MNPLFLLLIPSTLLNTPRIANAWPWWGGGGGGYNDWRIR